MKVNLGQIGADHFPLLFTFQLNVGAIPEIGLFFFFKILFFREKGREGEKEGEKYQYMVASHASPPGDLAHNPGMCPDWELNH